MNNRGFTLIELAIVVTMVALAVVAMTGFKDLVRASEVRSVVTDLRKFESAIIGFQLNYGALPGDLENATEFWPSNSKYPGYSTSNGNNNQRINGTNEGLNAWEHLFSADLIEGRFTGTLEGGEVVVGANVPRSRYQPAGYWLGYQGGNGIFLRNGNHIRIAQPSDNAKLNNAAITPKDAWLIDVKMDDGEPDEGAIRAANGRGVRDCLNTNKHSNASPPDAYYILDNKEVVCRLWWWLKKW